MTHLDGQGVHGSPQSHSGAARADGRNNVVPGDISPVFDSHRLELTLDVG